MTGTCRLHPDATEPCLPNHCGVGSEVSSCRHAESHWIGVDRDDCDPPMWRCDDCGEVNPSHWPTVWCDECGGPEPVVEEGEEQVGFEEQARRVWVRRLDCGHEEVTPR